MTATLVLASASPRRADFLRLLGLSFEVEPPAVDESRHPGEHPHGYVERLARAKAEAVLKVGRVTVGADTVVVLDGDVIGKPAHPAEAEATLRRLSGSLHHVATGVAVASLEEGSAAIDSSVATAMVRMAPMTETEITGYLASGEPLDKAGSYALQGLGGVFVESIDGHPSTVAGLPLPALVRLLARHGISVFA